MVKPGRRRKQLLLNYYGRRGIFRDVAIQRVQIISQCPLSGIFGEDFQLERSHQQIMLKDKTLNGYLLVFESNTTTAETWSLDGGPVSAANADFPMSCRAESGGQCPRTSASQARPSPRSGKSLGYPQSWQFHSSPLFSTATLAIWHYTNHMFQRSCRLMHFLQWQFFASSQDLREIRDILNDVRSPPSV